jgi:hypothetical protein
MISIAAEEGAEEEEGADEAGHDLNGWRRRGGPGPCGIGATEGM